MDEKEKILVVDDDLNICDLVKMYLEKEGFDVILAYDGSQAINSFKSEAPSLVILDIMLPKIDGLQVLKEIRRISPIPVIMLTAKGETFDKILGLELGSDDYMVKPFDPKELVARVRAVLRRYNSKGNNDTKELIFKGLSINLSNYELTVGGQTMDIPPKELELLYFLASNPNMVFTREQLLDKVWGFDYFGDSRTVDVHVKRLREKLEGHEQGWSLKTVWGVGYKFEVK